MQKTFSGAETRRDLCYMKYIAVDPPSQKQGIGRALLDFVFFVVSLTDYAYERNLIKL